MEIIKARVEVREVKRIARNGDREGAMILVRLGSEERGDGEESETERKK